MLVTYSDLSKKALDLLDSKTLEILTFNNEIDFKSNFIEQFKICYKYKLILIKFNHSSEWYVYQVTKFTTIKNFIRAKSKGTHFNTFKSCSLGKIWEEDVSTLEKIILESSFSNVKEELDYLVFN